MFFISHKEADSIHKLISFHIIKMSPHRLIFYGLIIIVYNSHGFFFKRGETSL
jgi:hypothetical protein